ncbi:MAG: class I SAM-dependent methyltransferase [Myxococcota bacterium]
MRILRWAGIASLALVLVAAVLYALRTNPLGPVSGRALTGQVVNEPITDWSFSDAYTTIAVETRPAAPHSVTTICFTLDGALYVPADKGSRKTWTHFAIADPRVRVKIGSKVYPARATRVLDDSLRSALTDAARAKYDFEGDRSFDDVWLFRMESRLPDVAAAPPPAARSETDLRALAQRVVSAPDRDPKDREMDARRHPADLLEFARVEPGMRVADLGAGAGYTTELLARAVGPSGTIYGQNTPQVIERYVSESWPERLSKGVMGRVVRVDSPLDAPLPDVRDLDLVTMVFVYHDTLFQEVDRAAMNRAIFEALAPGGSLVIVDHRAQPGSGVEVGETLHRIDEGLLRRELLSAGFQLAAESEFLANPADPRDRPFFKLDFPTDAFVHRYVKPLIGPERSAGESPAA